MNNKKPAVGYGLKPCAHCKGRATVHNTPTRMFFVQCNLCEMQTALFSVSMDAVNAWNLRAEVPEIRELHVAQIKLRAADGMAKAIDTLVERGILDARSLAADARLDYGDPFKYEYAKWENLALEEALKALNFINMELERNDDAHRVAVGAAFEALQRIKEIKEGRA